MIGLRTNAGSALVDYVIPTAVIGLIAGIALYTLNDDNLLKNFIIASTGNKVVTEGGTLAVGEDTNTTEADWNTDEVVEAGMTTTESPELESGEEISCAGGVCTMNVGGYTLTSIPEDIADYVGSTGPAGGQDLIASMFEQIIAQMEAEADPDQTDLLSAIIDLADHVGMNPSTGTVSSQLASNSYLLETLIKDTYSNDPKIYIDGDNIREERTTDGNYIQLSNTDILAQMSSVRDKTSIDYIVDTVIPNCAAEASGVNGKDYSELINTLNYLQKQATEIDVVFFDEVSSLAPSTDLAGIKKVNLQTVKDNVASKMEDVTAASIIAAAKGEI